MHHLEDGVKTVTLARTIREGEISLVHREPLAGIRLRKPTVHADVHKGRHEPAAVDMLHDHRGTLAADLSLTRKPAARHGNLLDLVAHVDKVAGGFTARQ